MTDQLNLSRLWSKNAIPSVEVLFPDNIADNTEEANTLVNNLLGYFNAKEKHVDTSKYADALNLVSPDTKIFADRIAILMDAKLDLNGADLTMLIRNLFQVIHLWKQSLSYSEEVEKSKELNSTFFIYSLGAIAKQLGVIAADLDKQTLFKEYKTQESQFKLFQEIITKISTMDTLDEELKTFVRELFNLPKDFQVTTVFIKQKLQSLVEDLSNTRRELQDSQAEKFKLRENLKTATENLELSLYELRNKELEMGELDKDTEELMMALEEEKEMLLGKIELQSYELEKLIILEEENIELNEVIGEQYEEMETLKAKAKAMLAAKNEQLSELRSELQGLQAEEFMLTEDLQFNKQDLEQRTEDLVQAMKALEENEFKLVSLVADKEIEKIALQKEQEFLKAKIEMQSDELNSSVVILEDQESINEELSDTLTEEALKSRKLAKKIEKLRNSARNILEKADIKVKDLKEELSTSSFVNSVLSGIAKANTEEALKFMEDTEKVWIKDEKFDTMIGILKEQGINWVEKKKELEEELDDINQTQSQLNAQALKVLSLQKKSSK